MVNKSRESASVLSEDEFAFICDFVFKQTGIVLNEGKREMVYRRFSRIVRERKLPSFKAYYELLKSNPDQEMSYFINAITTNLTSFFRENHHFDYLINQELPRLLKTKRQTKHLRIWSCASSTGEEPYSIAISVVEAMNSELPAWDAKILATDIDTNVLAHGKNGIYDIKRIEGINPDYKGKYFHRGTNDNQNKIKVDNKLKKLLTFKSLNLLHEWPMKRKFDIIFCRNVIIYFNKATQQELFHRYYDILEPGGLLILGHSESLGKAQRYFENVGRTIFRKPLNIEQLGEDWS